MNISLRQRISSMTNKDLRFSAILNAFIEFFSDLQGFDKASIDQKGSIWSYGLDSLSAVSCQFWFHRGMCIKAKLASSL